MRRTFAGLVLFAAIALAFQPASADLWSVEPSRDGGSTTADTLRQFAEAAGDDADLFARAASAYSDTKMPAQALELQQRAVALRPGDSELLAAQAAYARWAGNYALAEASYRELLDIDPENAEAWLGLARVQSWQNSLDASAHSYSRYRELEPEDATALAEYARVLSYRGDYPRALDVIEAYRELAGETPVYRSTKANILAWADRPEAALEVARVGLESEPDDPDLVCTQAVALNQAREFRRSLERLNACAEPGALRGKLESSLKPLSIRGIRQRLPYRADYDWEFANLLRPVAMFDLHYRGDTEDIHTVESSVVGYVPINPEFFIGATAGYEHLWADRGSRYETKDGDRDIGYGFVAAELETRVAKDVWLGAQLGANVTTESETSLRYRIALDARPADALQVALVQEQRLFSYSPSTVSRGTDINRTQLLARWAPDLRYVVEAGGGYDSLSDDNDRWHAFVAPRRAVVRRQRLTIDLGVRGEWSSFEDQQFGNGYYDPDSFQRYVGTMNLSAIPREKLTLNVYAAAGVSWDETTHGVDPAGSLFAEANFGAYNGWLFKLRGGVGVTTRDGDNFTGWVAGLRIIRRF
jgi:tetratricopeptide (TPR) repeat protein